VDLLLEVGLFRAVTGEKPVSPERRCKGFLPVAPRAKRIHLPSSKANCIREGLQGLKWWKNRSGFAAFSSKELRVLLPQESESCSLFPPNYELPQHSWKFMVTSHYT
ncbi:MAG: hypothetical protein JO071_06515, partial [Deltaproteobacteria bacterium]|nr:hypothetical protein [Deltaproteobacteria bacterium]